MTAPTDQEKVAYLQAMPTRFELLDLVQRITNSVNAGDKAL